MIADAFLREQSGSDGLVEGYYLLQRRRARRVDLPIRIWFGPPLDIETGEELDRSPRWQIMVAGTLLDELPARIGFATVNEINEIWPVCANEPIDEAEYEFRMARQEWAALYDPEDPLGTPGARIDPLTARLPFGD